MTKCDDLQCYVCTLVILIVTSVCVFTMMAFSLISIQELKPLVNDTATVADNVLFTGFLLYLVGGVACTITIAILLYFACNNVINLVYEDAVTRVQAQMAPTAESVEVDDEHGVQLD